MFNGLDNFVQQSLQRDMQNKIIQAQLQAKESEKHLVSKKYDSGYPGVFGAMTNALDDASIAYGNRFNETIRSKQGFTQELLTRVWDDGMHLDHTRYLNDIRSYRDMMNIHKMKVTACTTLAEADLEFSKTEDQYNKFFSNWKIKTAESANRWSAHFDKLVIEENNPVANVAQNLPNQNPVPQGGDDLLQQLNAVRAELEQKNGIINSLAQGMQMAQGAIVQAQQIIQEKDTKIADQKLTIDDLRQDKIELREKVSEQKNSIDSLTETNLEQAEKIHQVSDKYLGLKTHFVDLVTLHQEDYPDYVPVVDLAGLDLNL